jgi:hypothetical protein
MTLLILMIFLVLFMVHSLPPADSKKTNSLKRPKGINSFKDENSIQSRSPSAQKSLNADRSCWRFVVRTTGRGGEDRYR